MTLFSDVPFVSHAGLKLPYKIDCDALTDADIECLAKVIAGRFTFARVRGVPSGGFRLSDVLQPYANGSDDCPTLIVDDVLTTGASIMESAREYVPYGQPYIGVVIFARGPWPEWVTPMFASQEAISEMQDLRRGTKWQRLMRATSHPYFWAGLLFGMGYTAALIQLYTRLSR